MQTAPINNISRKDQRWLKRELKALTYRAVALNGGGKREVARRLRQLARRA